MSLANLKRASGNLDKLSKAIEALNTPTESNRDENFWRPATDRSGNGLAIIRFMSAPEIDGEDALPWAKMFSHGFQGPGGQWYIDNCLTTKNQQCPVCDHNSVLWNTGIEANKEIVRKQKRKLNYVANVYVISDPKNPENEGKVFYYRFGKKIFDKITEAMNPQFEDEKPINPFDFWKGANFKLKIRKVEGYANYDKSEFEKAAPLFASDEEIEKVWKQARSLTELVADKHFKTFAEQKGRLDKVLGLNGNDVGTKTTVEQAKSQPRKPVVPEDVGGDAGDDDSMEYFKNLANAN